MNIVFFLFYADFNKEYNHFLLRQINYSQFIYIFLMGISVFKSNVTYYSYIT